MKGNNYGNGIFKEDPSKFGIKLTPVDADVCSTVASPPMNVRESVPIHIGEWGSSTNIWNKLSSMKLQQELIEYNTQKNSSFVKPISMDVQVCSKVKKTKGQRDRR